MHISLRSKRRSKKLGPVIGYKINGLVYAPSDVIIIHAERPRWVRNIIHWLRSWLHIHRKSMLVVLLVIVLCILSAVITAHHPT
jgi:hypothetical protein